MTLEMDGTLIIVSGFIQGLGIGFTFVPLSAATFATLAPHLRNDGTPIYSLMRNIGSSVGISIVQALLTEGAARAHAELAVDITYTNQVLQSMSQVFNPGTPAGLSMLNAEVTRQATMMAYVSDFRVMMVITLLTMPLLLLIRRPASVRPIEGSAIEPTH